MVKNEQDIIEPFVRHNLRYLDALLVADNGSVDDTRAILVGLARELNQLVLADIPDFGFTQAEHMTRVLHAAQTAFFADYIVFLDADEFINVTDRTRLLSELTAIPPGCIGLVPWQTYVLVPNAVSMQSADPPRTIGWRRTEERPQWRKAILRLDGAHIPDLKVAQGNHNVTTASGDSLPSVMLDTFGLQHFPIRGRDQFVGKCVVGWMAMLAKDVNARIPGASWQWRDITERIAVGGQVGDAELAKISQRYASEHVAPDWTPEVLPGSPPTGYTRRYSTGAASEALPLIVRSWTQSLAARPPLLDFTRPPPTMEATVPQAGGAFDAAWHWDHLLVDIPPFRAIAERHQPASVLDVGCGIGAYLRLFRRLGTAEVFGVDGVQPETTVLDPSEYAVHDLTMPLDLGRTFDLVVCTEVAEHLDPDSATVLIGTIARHARRLIVFSAAEPGQPGNGHINCQPLRYWLDLWQKDGWRPEAIDTLALRTLASLSWLRRNLIVLRPEREVRQDATAVLERIAARPFTWYGQQPGIRETPFMEGPPENAGGYG